MKVYCVHCTCTTFVDITGFGTVCYELYSIVFNTHLRFALNFFIFQLHDSKNKTK